MTTSFNVSKLTFSLGAADATTGHYAHEYAAAVTIKMIIMPQGTVLQQFSVGNYAKYEQTGFTTDVLAEWDVIIDGFGTYYRVGTIEKWKVGEVFSHYRVQLSTMPFGAQQL